MNAKPKVNSENWFGGTPQNHTFVSLAETQPSEPVRRPPGQAGVHESLKGRAELVHRVKRPTSARVRREVTVLPLASRQGSNSCGQGAEFRR